MNSSTQHHRRRFLRCCAAGAAASSLSLQASLNLAAELGDAGPLAPQRTHHEPKAKRLIVVFLTGGFSHVDTFDYKPELAAKAGQLVSSNGLRDNETGKLPLLGSPFKWAQHGQSGLWISELFPHLAKRVD